MVLMPRCLQTNEDSVGEVINIMIATFKDGLA